MIVPIARPTVTGTWVHVSIRRGCAHADVWFVDPGALQSPDDSLPRYGTWIGPLAENWKGPGPQEPKEES